MTQERFIPIKGYENYILIPKGMYAVSNFGRVASYKYGKVRFLKFGGGNLYQKYPYVVLVKNGERKTFTVHRLVAEAFIPNPENLPCVCHRDDNPFNNHVDNLFWGTQQDNQDDCQEKGRHAKPKRPVVAYNLDGSFFGNYISIREAEKKLGIRAAHIQKVAAKKLCVNSKGAKWIPETAGGLIWQYA